MSNESRTAGNPNEDNAIREIFEGLFDLLENLETQNVAILQFLKENADATDQRLKPYLDKAGNAASVKWRAHRARMEHLFTPIPEAAREQKEARKEKDKDKGEGESKSADKKGVSPQDGKQSVGTPNPITGAVSDPPKDA